jgi:NADH-quinone oxidoreductase subunit N
MNAPSHALALGADLPQMAPYLVLAAGGLVVMLVDAFTGNRRQDHLSLLTLLTLLGAAAVQGMVHPDPRGATLLGGMLAADRFSRFFNLLTVTIAMLTTVYATSMFERDGRYRTEFYPLVLFAALGMMLLAAATDLLSLFLAIETMSLAVYVLVAGNRGSLRSSEAGFKYLILGAFASAFLLMGLALLYGQAGATDYASVRRAVESAPDGGILLPLACGLVLVALGFKVAMVPFHMWTPDVYEGAPAYVTGLMAAGVKAAAFAALLRVLWLLPPIAEVWFPLLAVLAVLTMTYGNLVALSQSGLKRMLAYSSIAHAGYLLLGVLAVINTGRDSATAVQAAAVRDAAGGAILFYLVVYALMNLGAFGVVACLSRSRDEEADAIDGYAGLSRRRPFVAATLAVFMFSLAGIPPTAGFVGKFYIFDAVVKAGLVPLAVWGVINSLLSAYYYLRVIVVMYMKPVEGEVHGGHSWEAAFTCGVLALLVLLLGVLPGSFFALATHAFRQMVF